MYCLCTLGSGGNTIRNHQTHFEPFLDWVEQLRTRPNYVWTMTENITRLGKANSFCDVCSLPVKQHDKLKDVAWRKHSQWCKRVWQRICSDSTAVSQIEDQCTESQHFSQAILSVFLISLAFLKTPCAWIQETSLTINLGSTVPRNVFKWSHRLGQCLW